MKKVIQQFKSINIAKRRFSTTINYIEVYGTSLLKENERINVEDYYDEYGTELTSVNIAS